MRQFATTYLYRVSFKKQNNWQKSPPPLYLIAENEKEAIKSARRNISNFEVSTAAKLGKQYGDFFFKE